MAFPLSSPLSPFPLVCPRCSGSTFTLSKRPMAETADNLGLPPQRRRTSVKRCWFNVDQLNLVLDLPRLARHRTSAQFHRLHPMTSKRIASGWRPAFSPTFSPFDCHGKKTTARCLSHFRFSFVIASSLFFLNGDNCIISSARLPHTRPLSHLLPLIHTLRPITSACEYSPDSAMQQLFGNGTPMKSFNSKFPALNNSIRHGRCLKSSTFKPFPIDDIPIEAVFVPSGISNSHRLL